MCLNISTALPASSSFSLPQTHTTRTPQGNKTCIFNSSVQEWFLTRKKNNNKTPIVLITAEFEYKGEGCGGKEQKAASGIRGCYRCALLSSYRAGWHLSSRSLCFGHGQQLELLLRAPGLPPPMALPCGFTPGHKRD